MMFGLLAFFLVVNHSSLSAQSGWTVLSSGVSQNLNAVQFLNPDTGFAAGDAGVLLRTLDGGNTWSALPLPLSMNLSAVHFFSMDSGLVTGPAGQILRTSDGGSNWSLVPTGITDNLLDVAFFNDSGICGASSQSIIYSADAGRSWSIAQSGFFGGGFNGMCMLSPQIGMLGGENSIFQPLAGFTQNGGASWSFSTFYLSSNEGNIRDIEFTDVNIGYAACRVWNGQGAIARTGDGGANWSSQLFPAPFYGIDFPISNASLIGFAVGENGAIYKTVDAGGSWLPQQSTVSARLNDVHFLDPDWGYAVGNGGTILKTTSGGEPPTHLQQEGQSAATFQLLGNYPNPFNPATTIGYRLGRQSELVLTIYDVQGRTVAVLRPGVQAAGEHALVWNAQSSAASGIYYYRLNAGTEQAVGKMVLLR